MKWEGIARITRLFASDKQTHLEYYQGGNNFAVAKGYRERRNNLKSTNYHKTLLLPVHMSDLAIKSAYETELKYWASIAEGIRIKKWWSKVQIQYAMWLLGDAQRFSNLIEGRAAINEKLYLTLKERHAIQNNLRRQARRIMKKRPEVRIARSFELDNTLYSLYESESGQGISVSSVEKGKRIRIPLKGKSELSGNIRVVLFPETRSIEIHQSQEIKVSPPQSDEVVALDVGITEVFADDAGNIYGESLGEVLKTASAKLKDKGIKRNKLHAVQKKYRKQGKAPKASNIGKYNLGGKTLRNRRDRVGITISDIINQSINEVIEKRNPKVIVTEKLDIRGKAYSKEISRRVSLWHRRKLKERIEFKASVAGCDRKQINPAYTSQVCPDCGYLNKANRRGDKFQCKNCQHTGHADVIAAVNQKARLNDHQITPYTPKETVRLILVRRYEARIEHRNASEEKIRTVTAPG